MKKIISLFLSTLLFFQISLASVKKDTYYLNLKDLPLKDFVISISKILNINVNVPENLRGKVTFVSNSPLSKDEIFLIFLNILKERGLYLKKVGKNTYLITSSRYARIYPGYRLLVFSFKDKNKANEFFQTARNFISSGETIRVVFDTVFLYVEKDKVKFFYRLYKKFSKEKENNLKSYKLFVLKIKNINDVIIKNLAQKYFSLLNFRDFFLGYERKKGLLILFAPKEYGERFIEIIRKIDASNYEEVKKENNLHLIKLKYIKGDEIEKVLKKAFARDKNVIISSIPSENYILVLAPEEKFEEIKNIINTLDQRKPLVAIQTQIVELSVNKNKNYSFQSSFQVDLDKDNSLAFGILFPSSESLSIAPAPGFNIGIIDINNNILKALLNAYKSEGLATILSSPNLLTLSGKPAVIEVSKVIPFQTGQKYDSNGNPIITYEYKDVGLKLEITPYVKNKEYILLKIKQDVSDVTGYASSQTLPITAKRSIDTEVLIKNGQTLVIGGIKSKKVLKQENKIPILSDIPIIGKFFKREVKDYEDTNLMIFITPKILYNDEDVKGYTSIKEKAISLNEIKNILNRGN